MKTKIKIEKEVDIKLLKVVAGVRYWEDSQVNGEDDDEEGSNIPCKNGDSWCPEIDIETGKILNWKQGVKAHIHYKVCDDGIYVLLDDKGDVVHTKEGYVPECMYPLENGYGDYIIMIIDENGVIEDWEFDYESFIEE
jgi:hypothetical protein